MVVTVAGCGALGSLLAARMIEGGLRVQALQRPGVQLQALERTGIVIENDHGKTTRWWLEAVADDPSRLAPSRLVIVLVKAGDTETVASARDLLAPDGAVLTLQNGLGNGEKLAAIFGGERVAVGTDTYGAYRIAPGTIGWGGDGYINLGPFERGVDLSWVAQTLSSAGLNVTYLDDPGPAIWTKLALNLMVNPLTAVTGRRNGELLHSAAALRLMRDLGEEAVRVARGQGITLDIEVVWAAHVENLERTAANKTSMLQDIEAGRRTEIDAIAKPLLDLGGETASPTTRAIYLMIKAIEEADSSGRA